MADPAPVSEPDPTPAVDPGPAVPPGQTPAPPAAPSKAKPVVLATPLLHNFVIPGAGDDGTDLLITSAGTALTKAQAKRVEEAAQAAGVSLTVFSHIDARIDQMKRDAGSPEKD